MLAQYQSGAQTRRVRDLPDTGPFVELHPMLADRLGAVDAAIDDYLAAIRLSPPYPEPHYNLADAALERGDVDLALAHLDRALDLEPLLIESIPLEELPVPVRDGRVHVRVTAGG